MVRISLDLTGPSLTTNNRFEPLDEYFSESSKNINNFDFTSVNIDVPYDQEFMQNIPQQKYSNNSAFCKDMYPLYIKEIKNYANTHPELKIDANDIPVYAEEFVALNGLESGGGSSFSGLNNYGNVLVGSSGASYTLGRDHDGNGNPVIHKFRNFPSKAAFIKYHVNLIGNRYKGFAFGPNLFFRQVVNGGYAEDKNYYPKLLNAFKTEQMLLRK